MPCHHDDDRISRRLRRTERDRFKFRPKREEATDNRRGLKSCDQFVDLTNRDTLKSQHGIQDHVDPQNRVDRRHNKERGDQQDANNSSAREWPVDKNGDQNTKHDCKRQNAANDENAVLDSEPEILRIQNKIIVTTEKDAVRLAPLTDLILENNLTIAVLPIEVKFHFEQQKDFLGEITAFLQNFEV